jgi:dephospho-CoA kinase
MSDEELKNRLNSAIIEEQKAIEICDFIIDATASEEEVLREVLDIIQK